MTEQQSVAVKPIAPYLGGKLRLSKQLVEKIEKTPHLLVYPHDL